MLETLKNLKIKENMRYENGVVILRCTETQYNIYYKNQLFAVAEPKNYGDRFKIHDVTGRFDSGDSGDSVNYVFDIAGLCELGQYIRDGYERLRYQKDYRLAEPMSDLNKMFFERYNVGSMPSHTESLRYTW